MFTYLSFIDFEVWKTIALACFVFFVLATSMSLYILED